MIMNSNDDDKIVSFSDYKRKKEFKSSLKSVLICVAGIGFMALIILSGFLVRWKLQKDYQKRNEKPPKREFATEKDANFKDDWWSQRETNEDIVIATAANATADTAQSKYTVGCRVNFGTYPQNEDGDIESISWIVIATENGRALLLSEYILDSSVFYKSSVLLDGEISIRNWLNEDFYNQAFSKAEKNRVLEIQIENEDNSLYNADGDIVENDKIFILSANEMEGRAPKALFAAKATPYAQTGEIKVNSGNYSSYWLRSMAASDIIGTGSKDVIYVDEAGDINYSGKNSESIIGIRPAFWISIE